MKQFIEPLIQLMKKAGELVLLHYETDHDVQYKGDNTPYTKVDIASHQVIEEGLKALVPDIPILSEEGEIPDFDVRKAWQRYWLVDPLDGTREYLRKSGQFCINIALIEEHRPVLGMIYIPVTGECFYACKGELSYKQMNGNDEVIRTRPWKNKHSTLALTRKINWQRFLDKFKFVFPQVIHFKEEIVGSAIKFCRIAEGKADLYPCFGKTSEWDSAAGQVIVEQAGGHVVDLKWKELRYNTRPSLLNPQFIAVGDDELITKLKGDT